MKYSVIVERKNGIYRKDSPQAWIEAAGIWGEEDQEALQEYYAEIAALKQRQREEAEQTCI